MRAHRLFLVLALAPALVLAMGTPPKKAATAAPGAPGVMLRDDDLRASPSVTAASLAKLGKGAQVRVLAGDGGWTQVYAAGKTGWLRILSVKSDLAATPDLGALVEVGKRAPDSGRVVAVAGARGLDEVQLKSATFSADELTILDAFAASRADAEQFARTAGLAGRQIPHLPNPENPASPMSDKP